MKVILMLVIKYLKGKSIFISILQLTALEAIKYNNAEHVFMNEQKQFHCRAL